MNFNEYNFDNRLSKAIAEAEFLEPTEVQQETFKHALNGKDLCVQSQTGTGKTAAFLISIFQLFTEHKTPSQKALILVPTRELAVQIEKLNAAFFTIGCLEHFPSSVGFAQNVSRDEVFDFDFCQRARSPGRGGLKGAVDDLPRGAVQVEENPSLHIR